MLRKYVTASILLCLLMMLPPIHIVSAAPATVSVSPPDSYVAVGKSVIVGISVADVTNLTSWQFTLYFLNSVLNCTDVVEGPFLKTGGGTFFGETIINNYNSTHGKLLAYSTLLGSTMVNGGGVLATITFDTLSVNDSTLHLSDTRLGDENIPPHQIPHTINDGTVHVQNFTLAVNVAGSGTVTLNNTGPYYYYGEAVQLTAHPTIGWSLAQWSGNLTGSSNPATLIITGNMSVTATFTQNQYTLTITPVGSGSASKVPDQATYTWGTNVTLTASANLGWSFANWSGNISGTASPTTLNMTGDMSVTATFTQNLYTLTVSKDGSGSVTLNNTGPYHYDDVVQLNAVPTIGWTFDHWSGDLTESANPTTIVIDGNKAVTAHFVQINYSMAIYTVGSGSVTLNNTGPNYHYGDVVQLATVPTIGWTFDHWSGNLTGSANPATLQITGNMSVTATFTQNVYTLTVAYVGSGSVTLNNSGPYHYGDAIRLTTVPDPNWVFQYWTGDLSGSADPATLVITGNSAVVANFIQKPTLQMTPASKTCRMYSENFTIAINVSNAANIKDFKFEIHYNATLLNFTSLVWNAWGSGTINVDRTTGNVTGFTSGTAISGTQTLITIRFQAIFYHVWKSASGWTNDLAGTIYFQWANLSYATGPDLRYERGGLNQFDVGPDFAYTFSPIQGDVDNNGTIDVFDLRLAAAYFDVKQGDPIWSAASTYDLDCNGVIDVFDLRVVAVNFGYTYVP